MTIHSAYNSPVIPAGRLFWCMAAKKYSALVYKSDHVLLLVILEPAKCISYIYIKECKENQLSNHTSAWTCSVQNSYFSTCIINANAGRCDKQTTINIYYAPCTHCNAQEQKYTFPNTSRFRKKQHLFTLHIKCDVPMILSFFLFLSKLLVSKYKHSQLLIPI